MLHRNEMWNISSKWLADISSSAHQSKRRRRRNDNVMFGSSSAWKMSKIISIENNPAHRNVGYINNRHQLAEANRRRHQKMHIYILIIIIFRRHHIEHHRHIIINGVILPKIINNQKCYTSIITMSASFHDIYQYIRKNREEMIIGVKFRREATFAAISYRRRRNNQMKPRHIFTSKVIGGIISIIFGWRLSAHHHRHHQWKWLIINVRNVSGIIIISCIGLPHQSFIGHLHRHHHLYGISAAIGYGGCNHGIFIPHRWLIIKESAPHLTAIRNFTSKALKMLRPTSIGVHRLRNLQRENEGGSANHGTSSSHHIIGVIIEIIIEDNQREMKNRGRRENHGWKWK